MFVLGNGIREDNAWNMPEDYTSRFLRLLPMFDLRVVTTSGNWLIVEPARFGHPKYRTWFRVVDNGGEVIVQEINSEHIGISVPYKASLQIIIPATLADRVAAVIRGERINWEFTFSPDEESALLKGPR